MSTTAAAAKPRISPTTQIMVGLVVGLIVGYIISITDRRVADYIRPVEHGFLIIIFR